MCCILELNFDKMFRMYERGPCVLKKDHNYLPAHEHPRGEALRQFVKGIAYEGLCLFLKNVYVFPNLLPQNHDGSYTPGDKFFKDPDSLCTTISWRDEDDRTIWIYKIQVGR